MKTSKTKENILKQVKEWSYCHIRNETKMKLAKAFELANDGLITLERHENDYGYFWYIARKKKQS